MKFPARGLYAITQTENKSLNKLLSEITAVLQGGARVVQYRDKNPVNPSLFANELSKLCHSNNVPLIINDNIELALISSADGVHLGGSDGTVKEARNRLGDNAIVGISCYNSVDLAIDAEEQGASYVAFGRFFSSTSKPLATAANLSTLLEARKRISIPIVAIGGILPENGSLLIDSGADLLAVIGGLYTENPRLTATAYSALFH